MSESQKASPTLLISTAAPYNHTKYCIYDDLDPGCTLRQLRELLNNRFQPYEFMTIWHKGKLIKRDVELQQWVKSLCKMRKQTKLPILLYF